MLAGLYRSNDRLRAKPKLVSSNGVSQKDWFVRKEKTLTDTGDELVDFHRSSLRLDPLAG